MASSKTCLSPFCVNAEHSRYFTLETSFAICKPCAVVIGAIFFSFSFSTVSLSSRKSTFVPTRIIGVFGQWWLTSGYHFARTFSYDAGLVSEKQIKKTSYKKCNSAFTYIKVTCNLLWDLLQISSLILSELKQINQGEQKLINSLRFT